MPPFLPDYLKRKIDPSAALLFSSEDLNIEAFLRARAQQTENRRSRRDRYESRDYSDSADTPEDRERFEAAVLRQFGVTLPARTAGPIEPYHETAGRRFQIVFLLSLPITSAFSYGAVTAAKGTFGRRSSLNQGETLAVVLGGLLSSGYIAFRDLRLWREQEQRRLKERDEPGAKGASRGTEFAPTLYALPPLAHNREHVVPLEFKWHVSF